MDHSHLRRLSRPIMRPAAPAAPAVHSAVDTTPWSDPYKPISTVSHIRAPRRRVTACEVCGRTLLTGETSREIASGDHVLAACPLCAISAARPNVSGARPNAPRRAA
jgi:hypothetical protein